LTPARFRTDGRGRRHCWRLPCTPKRSHCSQTADLTRGSNLVIRSPATVKAPSSYHVPHLPSRCQQALPQLIFRKSQGNWSEQAGHRTIPAAWLIVPLRLGGADRHVPLTPRGCLCRVFTGALCSPAPCPSWRLLGLHWGHHPLRDLPVRCKGGVLLASKVCGSDRRADLGHLLAPIRSYPCSWPACRPWPAWPPSRHHAGSILRMRGRYCRPPGHRGLFPDVACSPDPSSHDDPGRAAGLSLATLRGASCPWPSHPWAIWNRECASVLESSALRDPICRLRHRACSISPMSGAPGLLGFGAGRWLVLVISRIASVLADRHHRRKGVA